MPQVLLPSVALGSTRHRRGTMAEEGAEIPLGQASSLVGKEDGAEELGSQDQYESIQTRARNTPRSLSRTQSATSISVRRMRSNNGHGCAELDHSTDEGDIAGGAASTEKDPFEVAWDSDNDPLCPRSMSPLHKWVIVFIVGMGSLCV